MDDKTAVVVGAHVAPQWVEITGAWPLVVEDVHITAAELDAAAPPGSPERAEVDAIMARPTFDLAAVRTLRALAARVVARRGAL